LVICSLSIVTFSITSTSIVLASICVEPLGDSLFDSSWSISLVISSLSVLTLPSSFLFKFSCSIIATTVSVKLVLSLFSTVSISISSTDFAVLLVSEISADSIIFDFSVTDVSSTTFNSVAIFPITSLVSSSISLSLIWEIIDLAALLLDDSPNEAELSTEETSDPASSILE